MSAPELPPISDRERHRPPSRSTSKSSLNQLTAVVTSKAYYTRLTSGATLPRNHSDSSLKGLLLHSQGATQSSGSVSSYPTGGGGGGGIGGGGGGDVGLIPPHLLNRCSSRALSWCATDNSAGSIPKLETLFEKRNPPILPDTPVGSISSRTNTNTTTNNNNNIQTPPPPPPPPPPPQVLRTNNNTNNNNNYNLKTSHNIIPPRSVSVNGLRRSDSQELAKIKHRKKRLQSECGAAEVETIGTVEQFGRLKMNGMRRSVSDNKLVDKKNVRNARLSSSRHLPVHRSDKLTARRASKLGGASTATMSMSKGMRRVSSVSAINTMSPANNNNTTTNNNNNSNRLRIDSNQDSENVEGGGVGGGGGGGGSEDSEEEEERTDRIREWLLGLDCADAPPEPVIEYADDPPQTDTALHVVYQEAS